MAAIATVPLFVLPGDKSPAELVRNSASRPVLAWNSFAAGERRRAKFTAFEESKVGLIFVRGRVMLDVAVQ
jgi:hypothetical protein